MPLESSADPALRESLAEFLLATFRLGADAPFVEPALLSWKYDAPRPDWSGPRSFVWKDGGAIVAHACMCPVTYSVPSGDVTGSPSGDITGSPSGDIAGSPSGDITGSPSGDITGSPSGDITGSYLIDWAASRTSAGAGVALLRSLSRKCDTLWAVGGSADTRSILPKLGYRHIGDLEFHARVLRPWRQFRTDPFPRGWKAPLRLARNTIWSLTPGFSPPPSWSDKPVSAFDDSALPLFNARSRSPFPCTRRTAELMNYFLACPGAKFSAALVLNDGAPRGWYVLSRIAGQTRIADLWVDSESAADWAAAYVLAVRSAAADPEACELVGSASIPPAREALARSGFRFRHSQPIFVLDPRKRFAAAPPVNVTFLESDLAYLSDPSYPYLT